MQLDENPLTKILNEKLKHKNFNNIRQFIYDKNRLSEFQFNLDDFNVDITRQSLNKEIKDDLVNLAKKSGIKEKIKALVSGSKINISEDRSVDHFNLRKVERFSSPEWKKLIEFSNDILTKKKYEHIVNVGVGGSDLGPMMTNHALKDFHDGPKIFYVSNIDPTNMSDVLEKCNPLKTLFIITSKSFGTLETLENAKVAKNWLLSANKSINNSMIAVTSSKNKALKWGFNDQNIFNLSENIGGRYSLWSSVAMPIILSIGEDNFKDLLNGARTMDEHFINEDIENNIPIILALLRVWNRNFLNRNSHCIVPYSNRLAKLPSWAQQLEMESNGKGVDIEGRELRMPASPLIWGEVGTTAQHSFFQFLHQGLEIIPLDILLPLKSSNKKSSQEINKNHKYLISNALAQADTLAIGSVNLIDKNKNFLGGRPSTIISWEKNTPFSIGKLIALYENITIACGFIWNINSFDQWGVELGKTLALKIENNKDSGELSPASKILLNKY
jgi:glucose-6-phosphate isomerase